MVKVSEFLRKTGNFLRPDDVKDNDVLEILGPGEWVSAKDSGLSKDVFRMPVKLPDGTEKLWTVNTTTIRNLTQAYGDETEAWVGKKVRVEVKRNVPVRGVLRDIIYGYPVLEAKTATEKELQDVVSELKGAGMSKVKDTVLEAFLRARGLTMKADEFAQRLKLKVEETAEGGKQVVL